MALIPYLMALVSIATLLLNKARFAIYLLAAQYVFAFLLALPVLQIRSLIARLLGGFLVGVILYSSERRFTEEKSFLQTPSLPRSFWFRFLTALIVFIVAWAFANQTQSFTSSAGKNIFLGSTFIMCLGSLMLGLYQSPMEAAVGMLTLLIGFDLFYGGIEPSLAIVVLMISIQLIISLATSYIMSIRHQAHAQEDGRA